MAQGGKKSARCMPRVVWIIATLVSLSLGLARPALAAGPQERVGEILAAVAAVIQDPHLQGAEHQMERTQRVRRIIVDAFDFAEMSRVVLGAHWARLTAEQQREFISLFGELFERSYNRLVLRFLSERETRYGAVTHEQDRALVQTTLVVRRTNEQLPVHYRLLDQGGQWAVFDVVVDGVSLTLNYRAQFDKIIRSASYEALVQKIKERLAQEPSQ
jgi:phospholipid transport system substrate-binding protein